MDIYLIIVIVLFILAISDLIVGVSNDAVNFLNSAIGSKVAPRHIIILVASLGILVGTTFSSGLMEVARKGIFHPDMFYLNEIMIIFLAVMLTDVLLLDLFNTFAMPTSTTVSIVFELLGAAVAVSTLKIAESNGDFANIINYINTGKALVIISGILLSVIVAFSVGAIMQFLTRILFSFNFKKNIKYFGALWGSVALTAITYFILIKGAKGTSFLSSEEVHWIKTNTATLIGISLVFWAIFLQIILFFTKANILRGIVLIGTFALALAFAANDLVNFIGVPLAGFSSYLLGTESSNPESLLMVGLKGKVITPTALLLIAGIIMVITIWFSKKARSVTKTEVNLARQNDGLERFESSPLARAFVRMSINFVNTIKAITPNAFQDFVNARFAQEKELISISNAEDKPAFDLIRASNNLMVASILISIATSFKLPLSTTYVTFMVAMGTSLADRAWGRESAVYRVNGVLTVIGGWFFTAFSAFTSAFILATILYFGGNIAIFILIGFVAFILFRTHLIHKKREKEENETSINKEIKSLPEMLATINSEIIDYVNSIPNTLKNTFEGLINEDRNILKSVRKQGKKLRKKSNSITSLILTSIELYKLEDLKIHKRFGKVITSLQAASNRLLNLTSNIYDHINNNHRTLSENQLNEFNQIFASVSEYFYFAGEILKNKNFEQLERLRFMEDEIIVKLSEFANNQIERIKTSGESPRTSMLYLNSLSDLENVITYVGRMVNTLAKK